ncbi:MAG: Mut7-C RNAse domain-containing protein [Herpetosiphon sp.]
MPHPEIAGILRDGGSVTFTYIPASGDQLEVFDAATLPEHLTALTAPPDSARFVLDVHLGRLAGYLRMLGFDTLYRNDYGDAELAAISADEHRVLLTRDIGLLKRSAVQVGTFVRAVQPREQVVEIVRRLRLFEMIQPFVRCCRCNGLLEDVAKEEISGLLLPRTRDKHSDFRRCIGCRNLYWQGSHHRKIETFIDRVMAHDPRFQHGHAAKSPEGETV